MIVNSSLNDFNLALISDSSFHEINYQTVCNVMLGQFANKNYLINQISIIG